MIFSNQYSQLASFKGPSFSPESFPRESSPSGRGSLLVDFMTVLLVVGPWIFSQVLLSLGLSEDPFIYFQCSLEFMGPFGSHPRLLFRLSFGVYLNHNQPRFRFLAFQLSPGPISWIRL